MGSWKTFRFFRPVLKAPANRQAARVNFRRRTRPSARAALLWGLLTIVVLHLGLVGIYARFWINDPIYAHRARLLKRCLAQIEDSPFIVVAFGTSRVGEGFDAKRIEPIISKGTGRRCVVFNFGFPGIGPMAELVYLRRLLDDGVRPDRVIVEAYAGNLANRGGLPAEFNSLSGERLSTRESRSLRHYGYPCENVERRRFEIAANPWGELRAPILSIWWPASFPSHVLWKQVRSTDANGWQGKPQDTVSDELRREATAVAMFEGWVLLDRWQPNSQEIAAMRDLIALCRSEGIDVMLLSMPEGPAFRSLYRPEIKARFDGIVAGLADESGVRWIDARDWFDDESLFYDSHHLTYAGAAVFAERFGKACVLP
jgi:hypothetical protein